jgi:branched-chain amino acid transport system ATP-binding protein
MTVAPERPSTRATTPEAEPVLELRDVEAGYGGSTVLSNISLSVGQSSAVALLGANGAGKTTLLRVAAGLLRPRRGSVHVKGADVTRMRPHERARRGVCLIPEGRGIFRSLTVKENLELQVPKWAGPCDIAPAIDAFPVLGARLHQVAASMSGGQQQMLSMARAYLARPDVVLLDEVSMGLAPLIVEQIFESLGVLATTGCALVIVEQYVTRALEMAETAYLLNKGALVYAGPAADLDEDAMARGYLGAGTGPSPGAGVAGGRSPAVDVSANEDSATHEEMERS